MELHGAEESALCERCLGQRLHNGQRQTGPRLTTLTQTHGGTDKDIDKDKDKDKERQIHNSDMQFQTKNGRAVQNTGNG